jgi:hypothetical protein
MFFSISALFISRSFKRKEIFKQVFPNIVTTVTEVKEDRIDGLDSSFDIQNPE